MKLNVDSPDDQFYSEIKALYDDFRDELELNIPYDPAGLVGTASPYNYEFRRCLIESVGEGCHSFISKGTLEFDPATGDVKDRRRFEAWEKVA